MDLGVAQPSSHACMLKMAASRRAGKVRNVMKARACCNECDALLLEVAGLAEHVTGWTGVPWDGGKLGIISQWPAATTHELSCYRSVQC